MTRLCIEEVARSKDIRLSHLMQRTGLCADTTSRYWHNKIKNMNFEVISKIAEAMDCKVVDLIKEER